jgi:Fur family ferric uptake transcriptional regulator
MRFHPDTVDEELRTLLRNQKMRVTNVRMAVLTTLHDHQGPMTHEQIMEVLSEGEYDKASVWRLLSELSEKGLLRRMDLGDRVWRYELLDACRSIDASHAHFLCSQCGDVACLPPLEIRTRSGELPGALHRAEFTVRIEGICGACVDV